jgi:hypothetical protein
VLERCAEQWGGRHRPLPPDGRTADGEVSILPESAAEHSLMQRIRQCLAFSHGQVLEQAVEVNPSTRYPAGLIEKVRLIDFQKQQTASYSLHKTKTEQ